MYVKDASSPSEESIGNEDKRASPFMQLKYLQDSLLCLVFLLKCVSSIRLIGSQTIPYVSFAATLLHQFRIYSDGNGILFYMSVGRLSQLYTLTSYRAAVVR